MFKTDRAVISLLFDMLGGKTGEISKVDYVPQKPEFDPTIPIEQAFPRSTPEAEGVPSKFIYDLLAELAVTENANMHHFMMLRHDKVICETSFAPYRNGDWHITHSMCKSFTGMAIGLLVDDGRLSLDDKIVDIFDTGWHVLNRFKLRDLTVWNLLTMTSGSDFYETGAISGNKWVETYLNADLKFQPGTQFHYNSMNSYMLSAIVTIKTGKTMFDFLKERIFNPMGITQIFWEASPEGITKGGWGLFIRPEDAAKLGSLYLHHGNWHGTRLISEKWVAEATMKQVENNSDKLGYGYQLWPGERPGSFAYNGMMGQDVFVYPDLDMVFTINAGDPEVFQDGELDHVIKKHMVGAPVFPDKLPPDPVGYSNLCEIAERLLDGEYFTPKNLAGGWGRRQTNSSEGKPHYYSWNKPYFSRHDFFVWLNGRTYELEMKSCGLFPITLQTFHNNFTDGISKIGFKYYMHLLHVLFYEGDCVQDVTVGFHKSIVSTVDEHGEKYLVGTEGEYTEDEDHNPVLKLRIAFLEEASSRNVVIHFTGDSVLVEFDETPGKLLIMGGLDFSVKSALDSNKWLSNILENGAEKVITDAVLATIRPQINGKLIKDNGAENEK